MSLPGIDPIALGRSRRATLLRRLSEMADAGQPMATNTDMMEWLDAPWDGVQRTMRGLVDDGSISIEYSKKRRKVTIVATGAVTDWQPKRGGPPKAAEPERPPKPPSFKLSVSTLAVGIPNRALYGKATDAVLALRRAGDEVVREGDRFKVNGRFLLDSEQLCERAARITRGSGNGCSAPPATCDL